MGIPKDGPGGTLDLQFFGKLHSQPAKSMVTQAIRLKILAVIHFAPKLYPVEDSLIPSNHVLAMINTHLI